MNYNPFYLCINLCFRKNNWEYFFQIDCNIPDRQVLVEKIVKLQRACARRQVGFDTLLSNIQVVVVSLFHTQLVIIFFILQSSGPPQQAQGTFVFYVHVNPAHVTVELTAEDRSQANRSLEQALREAYPSILVEQIHDIRNILVIEYTRFLYIDVQCFGLSNSKRMFYLFI